MQTLYKSEFLSHRVNYKKLHVAVMNTQSGAVKIYLIKNMPKFIDEGITTAIANKLNTDFGKYKYGFWNFSKTGVMKPTGNGVEEGVTSVSIKMVRLVTSLISPLIKLVQILPSAIA
ncbi:hypothetical protein [Lactobacillus helveticus]|uniref:hypothetical protein n=1 Tax=Lactobacillus helveticus TaxID=1587 RepID=UPI00355C6E46